MSRCSIAAVPDPERWAAFVDEHPKGSIFHTPAMYQVFKGTKHHEPLALAAHDKRGQILALLTAVRIQTLPSPLGFLSSRSVLLAEPLCRPDPEGVEALRTLIARHDAMVRGKVLFTEVRPLQAPGMEKLALTQSGYEYKDYLNFLLDLRHSPDQLWSSMTYDCRRRIRAGARKGMRVEDATTPEGVDILYHFIQLAYDRARVPLAHRSLFMQAYNILHPRNMIRISVAYHEDMPVAATVKLLYKKTAFAWYSGSERIPALNPMESLTWHEVQCAQRLGFELYDFGGAGWPDKPYGVREFKAKFGGQLVHYGRYRRVYSPVKFALAERTYEVGRSVVNPSTWRQPRLLWPGLRVRRPQQDGPPANR